MFKKAAVFQQPVKIRIKIKIRIGAGTKAEAGVKKLVEGRKI